MVLGKGEIEDDTNSGLESEVLSPEFGVESLESGVGSRESDPEL